MTHLEVASRALFGIDALVHPLLADAEAGHGPEPAALPVLGSSPPAGSASISARACGPKREPTRSRLRASALL